MPQTGERVLLLSDGIALSNSVDPVTGEASVVYADSLARGQSQAAAVGNQVVLVTPTLAQGAASGTVLPQPQHWWKLDGDAADYGTIGGVNGSLTRQASFSSGGPTTGQHLELVGDGWVDYGNPGFSNNEWKNHTHTFWVRIDSFDGSKQIWEASQEDGDEVRLEFDSAFGDDASFVLRNNTGNPRYSNDDASSSDDFDEFAVHTGYSFGQWFWLAAVLDAENLEMRLYKNGNNLVDSRPIPADLVPNFGERLIMGADSTTVILSETDPNQTVNQQLDGGIVDYRMYQSVLAGDQIQAIYDSYQ